MAKNMDVPQAEILPAWEAATSVVEQVHEEPVSAADYSFQLIKTNSESLFGLIVVTLMTLVYRRFRKSGNTPK